MKPCYLQFGGINSFSEGVEIDFNKLLEFGIFGIFGDTGSGKSTILDCIGFSLYGNVSRSRSGSIADVINYRAEKAFVNFEFEIVFEGKRRLFRVERELKRKNATQSVRVYEKVDGDLLALSEGVRESNALLERIVGLEQKDFEKCIALPQGEFAQFVKAQRSDRLKLISRLFNLEAYGERLMKRTNAKYAECAEEYRVALTRLEPYSAISKEYVDELIAQTQTLSLQEKEQEQARNTLREAEKTLSELFERKKEWETVEKRLAELNAQKEEISFLEKQAERLEKASFVLKAERELRVAKENVLRAKTEEELAKRELALAEEEVKRLAEWDESKTDAEILQLIEQKSVVAQAEQAEKKKIELSRSLEKMRRDYAEELSRFGEFFYDEEKTAIQTQLSALGEGDFLQFLEKEGKRALLKEEYLTFVRELSQIQKRYETLAEEVQPLIEKYTALSQESVAFAQLKQTYEAQEQKKAKLREELILLEKKNGVYRAHRERLQQLQTDGVRIKKELAEWETLIVPKGGLSLSEIEKQLKQKKEEQQQKTQACSQSAKRYTDKSTTYARISEKLTALLDLEKNTILRLQELLEEGAFESVAETKSLTEKYGNGQTVKERVSKFHAEYNATVTRVTALREVDFSNASLERLEQTRAMLLQAENAYSDTVRLYAVKQDELKRAQENFIKKKELEKQRLAVEKQLQVFEKLKKLFEGNKFMDFVAEEYLQSVAHNASGRLLSLTDGRYFLRYEGGAVGFVVGDNFNGGNTRGVYTLSGGETFLVSLSLALSLSAEICLKSLRPIEFFFLDEGFGTLDERLVDTVMDSLERLKSENFAIGIISHVEELKHRINKKLMVEKATEKRGSRIYAE